MIYLIAGEVLVLLMLRSASEFNRQLPDHTLLVAVGALLSHPQK
jgi:hypothetical protein